MPEKILILYIPVIHKGYLDFLIRVKNKVSKIFIIDRKLQEELLEIKPDIASLDEKNVKDLLGKLGFANIQILAADNIGGIKSKEIILVQDEISRNLAEKYLASQGAPVELSAVPSTYMIFLRGEARGIDLFQDLAIPTNKTLLRPQPH